MDRKQAKELVTDWLAGELSASKLEELKNYLEEHPTFRSEVNRFRNSWEDLEELDQEEYGVPYMGPELERKLQETTCGTAQNQSTGHQNKGPSATSHGEEMDAPDRSERQMSLEDVLHVLTEQILRPRFLMIAVTAALVLFATIYVQFVHQFSSRKWIARVNDVSSGATLIRGDRKLDVRKDRKIRSHDRLRVPDGASVSLSYRHEQTSLLLREGVRVEFRSKPQAELLSLERGSVKVDLSDEDQHDRFVVKTNDARARAVGTTFTITHDQNTRVEVMDGEVLFSSLMSNETARIIKQEFGRVTASGKVVSGPLFDGWIEEFDDVPNGARSDDGDTSWQARNRQGTEGRGFSVSDGTLLVTTARKGAGLENGGIWTSEPIDISGAESVNVKVGVGGHECKSSIASNGGFADVIFELRVSVDGGEPKKVVGYGGRLNFHSPGVNGLRGDTLKLQIAAVNRGTSSCFYLNHVSVLPELQR